MSSTVIPPGRKTRILPSACNPSTTVLSKPTSHEPPSNMRGTLVLRSWSTCSAFVGLGFPEELALGAARGQFATAMRARATGWEGNRTATDGWPAVTMVGMMFGSRGNKRVRGPGQKCLIRAWYAGDRL